VETVLQRAAHSVRNGDGPFFVECRTYRFRAHSMFDPELYRDKTEVELWKTRDPIVAQIARLKTAGASDEELAAVERDVAGEIARCVSFAESGDWEPVEDLIKDVYTPR
jgi:TPP-dependent pyruvate/acetoin dehydrogenase alpha subunit